MATMKNRVLWREGMFVLPQHFQQQQRHNDAMLREGWMRWEISPGVLRSCH